MYHARTLYIDSDISQLQIVSDRLKMENYRVDSAQTAQQALEKADHSKPDLIILDATLQDMDDYELCRTFKSGSKTEDLGILLFTIKRDWDKPMEEAWEFADQVKEQLKGYHAGATEYLNKRY